MSFSDWEGRKGHGLTRDVCVDTMWGDAEWGLAEGVQTKVQLAQKWGSGKVSY